MTEERPGLIRRCWSRLGSPALKYSVLSLLSIGFVAGIVFWGGFHAGLDATDTMEFCTSCHEMRDTVYPEYQQTIHYSNRTGVRATCPDCHVPKDFVHRMAREARASLELWGKLTGAIGTKEKFEAKRMELATREWARMKASDSRECRNCHTWDAMSSDLQNPSAHALHMQAKQDGRTCIDCHKGIAHHLPKEYRSPNE
jgi:cytochrome c-type protein NapC